MRAAGALRRPPSAAPGRTLPWPPFASRPALREDPARVFFERSGPIKESPHQLTWALWKIPDIAKRRPLTQAVAKPSAISLAPHRGPQGAHLLRTGRAKCAQFGPLPSLQPECRRQGSTLDRARLVAQDFLCAAPWTASVRSSHRLTSSATGRPLLVQRPAKLPSAISHVRSASGRDPTRGGDLGSRFSPLCIGRRM